VHAYSINARAERGAIRSESFDESRKGNKVIQLTRRDNERRDEFLKRSRAKLERSERKKYIGCPSRPMGKAFYKFLRA
jgi:hypothetical protein